MSTGPRPVMFDVMWQRMFDLSLQEWASLATIASLLLVCLQLYLARKDFRHSVSLQQFNAAYDPWLELLRVAADNPTASLLPFEIPDSSSEPGRTDNLHLANFAMVFSMLDKWAYSKTEKDWDHLMRSANHDGSALCNPEFESWTHLMQLYSKMPGFSSAWTEMKSVYYPRSAQFMSVIFSKSTNTPAT